MNASMANKVISGPYWLEMCGPETVLAKMVATGHMWPFKLLTIKTSALPLQKVTFHMLKSHMGWWLPSWTEQIQEILSLENTAVVEDQF